MVRTKASTSGTRVSAAKAPRKMPASSNRAGSSSQAKVSGGAGKERYSGGNGYNPQPVPDWQKGISSFFTPGDSNKRVPEENEKTDMKKMKLIEEDTKLEESSTVEDTKLEESSTVEDTQLEGPSTAEDKENNEPSKFQSNGLISDDDDD